MCAARCATQPPTHQGSAPCEVPLTASLARFVLLEQRSDLIRPQSQSTSNDFFLVLSSSSSNSWASLIAARESRRSKSRCHATAGNRDFPKTAVVISESGVGGGVSPTRASRPCFVPKPRCDTRSRAHVAHTVPRVERAYAGRSAQYAAHQTDSIVLRHQLRDTPPRACDCTLHTECQLWLLCSAG